MEVTPEAVGVALGIVSRSFEKQSARESTEETQEMAARKHKLQTSVDSLRREMALMQEEVAREHKLLTSVDSLKKKMTLIQEHWQQGAIGDEMAALPGVLKEEEAIKEKDEPLREAQAEVAREHQLPALS